MKIRLFICAVLIFAVLDPVTSLKPKHRVSTPDGRNRRRQAPRKDRVRFFIYPDRNDVEYREEIVVGNNVSLSKYNPRFYPILLIHGFMQNFTNKYPQRTKDAYLKQGFPANIILVDWKGMAQPRYGYVNNLAFGYPQASKQVNRIAKKVSDFLMFLMEQHVLKDPTSVHVVGFSLGAQIAGVTGHYMKQSTGDLLGRITALDPSGLQFHLYSALSDKLDKDDAKFVDVVHTGNGPFGYVNSIGTVDFYPNGGSYPQPGCKAPVDLQRDMPGIPGSCSHNRAWEFFTDSIYNHNIYACQASSWIVYKMKNSCVKAVLFGQFTPSSAKGDYFLELHRKD